MSALCNRCGVSIKEITHWAVDQVLCSGCFKVGKMAIGRSPDELLRKLVDLTASGKGCYSYGYWIRKLSLWNSKN